MPKITKEEQKKDGPNRDNAPRPHVDLKPEPKEKEKPVSEVAPPALPGMYRPALQRLLREVTQGYYFFYDN